MPGSPEHGSPPRQVLRRPRLAACALAALKKEGQAVGLWWPRRTIRRARRRRRTHQQAAGPPQRASPWAGG